VAGVVAALAVASAVGDSADNALPSKEFQTAGGRLLTRSGGAQGSYGADSISTNLTAQNTIQSTLHKGEKVVATATAVVSSDGKSLTITAKGTDQSGKGFSNVLVYTKE
jgi:hypothetical protein